MQSRRVRHRPQMRQPSEPTRRLRPRLQRVSVYRMQHWIHTPRLGSDSELVNGANALTLAADTASPGYGAAGTAVATGVLLREALPCALVVYLLDR